MKSKIKNILLTVTGVGLFASSAMGAVSLANGDLAVAFYQTNGLGAVQANTYVFDLGNAGLYRDNSANNVSVSTVNSGIVSSNISADLVSAFGSTWATDGSVHWMVVGGTTAAGGTVNQDAARIGYYSKATSSVPAGVPDFGTTLNSTTRTQSVGSITTFFTGVQSQTAGSNAKGAIILTSATNTIDEFVNTPNETVNPGTYFKLGTDITQTVTSNGYATGLVGALDMFRVLATTTGSKLTAGLSTGNAAVGTGQYIGTLTLSSTGNLSIGSLTAVPEPSALCLTGLLAASGLTLRSRRTRNA